MGNKAKNEMKTILYNDHKDLGGKIVPFGGWVMPVSYTSVLDEHRCVRENVGIFDVSHMGEIFVSGLSALQFLQQLTINDASRLKIGSGQYTAMCNFDGGMIDDLILYRVAEHRYLLCVNASNTDKDYEWISNLAKDYSELTIKNESSVWSQVAIQGPNCNLPMQKLLPKEQFKAVCALNYTDITTINIFGNDVYIARTGYTGEKGYEVYMPNSIASQIWNSLLQGEDNEKALPIGLGARDTLRLEACYLLYGNDMDEDVSPLEAGIGWATKLDAKDFMGCEALRKQKQEGPRRRIYAFQLTDKGIARSGMKVFVDDQEVGVVTSGSVLPTVGGAGGMALITSRTVKVGDSIEIDVRGRKKRAVVLKRPLYTANVK